MLIKQLKSWFQIPVFWLWTWKMWWDREADITNDQFFIDSIKKSLDSWINLIDTAELYWNWHTEELVWKAIKWYDRNDLFITSKVFTTNLHYDNVISSFKRSLEKIWTDYLDLYLVHFHNPAIPLEETMEAMNYLYDNGVIKNIWVCNFKKETLEKAQEFSKAKIVLNQCHYNLIYREPENSWLIKYCEENDIIMQAWRPLQYWDLSILDNDLLKRLSRKYNKTYSQIAVNWLISQENIVTITKMSSENHIKENLWALWWKMDYEDIELLRKNYPNQQMISNSVPLG